MKFKNKKSKLTLLLVVITIGVWGIIIYKVIDYLNSPGEGEKEIIIDNNEAALVPAPYKTGQEEALVYLTIDRDPFIFRKKQKVKEIIPVEIIKVDPPKSKLDYEIKGIIFNEKSKLIVFEDNTNNKTVFLHEGEFYQAVKINKITADKVILEEEGVKKKISIK